MKEKLCGKVINNKTIIFYSLLVVFLISINSITALAPLCKYSNSVDFDGTWSYNDDGSGNDFSVTCRNGRLTSFCVTPALARGPHPNVYSCEGIFETSCRQSNGISFTGTWHYNDDGSGNDFAVTCENGKFNGFGANDFLGRGSHTDLLTYPGNLICKSSNGNFDGTWHFNDYGNGNDFAVVCRNGELSAFCAEDWLPRGFNSGVYACGGSDKDQDGVPYPADCNDNDAAIKPIIFYLDNDSDGFGAGDSVTQCRADIPLGYSPNNLDCNDNNFNVKPNAPETCNQIDDNCNGLIDESNGNCAQGLICSQGNCILPVCSDNSQCNDNNPKTEDKCINPGTAGSQCIHENIACLTNLECGSDILSNAFCNENNLFKNLSRKICVNPATSRSFCTTSIMLQLFQNCGVTSFENFGNKYCKNNSVYHSRTVNNKGCADSNCFENTNIEEQLVQSCTSNQLCSNGECLNIACKNDSQCNDNNPKTEDKCINSGTANSSCSHTQIICSTNSDCGTDSFTGNSFCSSNQVKRDYINFSCNLAGTGLSFCTNSTVSQVITNCSELCSNGQCIKDSFPPGQITNLSVDSKSHNWIFWKWTNPTDSDFCGNIIYLNGKNIANTTNNYYNATKLRENTKHKITVYTKDCRGNINWNGVSDTEKTSIEPDDGDRRARNNIPMEDTRYDKRDSGEESEDSLLISTKSTTIDSASVSANQTQIIPLTAKITEVINANQNTFPWIWIILIIIVILIGVLVFLILKFLG